MESAWKKEKDIVSKEIEKLRLSIQTLCKSALPLGKIMDYLQEDADAMQNELQLWHHENQQHAEALQKEQRSGAGPVWAWSGAGSRWCGCGVVSGFLQVCRPGAGEPFPPQHLGSSFLLGCTFFW